MTETKQTPKELITATVKTGIAAYEGNVAEFIEFANVMKNSEYMTGRRLQAKTLELMHKSIKEENYENALHLKNLYTSFGDNAEYTRNAEKVREFNELNTQITLAETSANEVTEQDIMRMTIKVENCGSDGNRDGFPALCEKLDNMCAAYSPDSTKYPNLVLDALTAQFSATQGYDDEMHLKYTPVIYKKLKDKAEELFYSDPIESFKILGRLIDKTSTKERPNSDGKFYAIKAANAVLDFGHQMLPNEAVCEPIFGSVQVLTNRPTTMAMLIGKALEKTSFKEQGTGEMKYNPEIEASARAYLQKRFLVNCSISGFEDAYRSENSANFTFAPFIESLKQRNDDFLRKLPTDKKKQELFLNMVRKSVTEFDATYTPTEFIPKKPAAGAAPGPATPGMK